MKNVILIRGASQNNLKNLDIDLPLNQITVVTGVSGAGKSSLAFDTLYAEGQRRYVESFSAYARQFLERMDKPCVNTIEGIPPAIAINQVNPIKTSRSTLGTLTEITDYLKLLFPSAASLYCRSCGSPVEKDTAESVAKKLCQCCAGRTAVITFPFACAPSQRVTRSEMAAGLRRMGFYRLYSRGAVIEHTDYLLQHEELTQADVVVDRVAVSEKNIKRMLDSLEMALKFGKGLVTLFFPADAGGEELQPPLKFSAALHCPQCDITYHDPFPSLFSFNSPLGACSSCNGFGKTIAIDLDLVVPDHGRSLQDDAVKPWATPAYREAYYDLIKFCKRESIPVDIPFAELSQRHRDLVVNGSADFYGIRGFFNWLETRTYKMHIRVLLSKYRGYATCPQCSGTRFQPDTLLYRLAGKTIADICAMSIAESCRFFSRLDPAGASDKASQLLLQEIRGRLGYLNTAGLGYLTLDRQSRTLSGGEVERASLTTALGSSLVNTLYILDEPSIGLHARDNQRLIAILKSLRDAGNTIVVVEHDPEIILESDYVIDLGPAAGERGGQMIFCGPSREIVHSSRSLTGRYLAGDLQIPVPHQRRKTRRDYCLTLQGASANNLKQLDLSIPLGMLVCITGVSGSGKSTLLENVLYQGLQRIKGKGGANDPACAIHGAAFLDQVMLMDQSPVGRTPRSNPATYLKLFDEIRKLFARTAGAREHGYTASAFSFNAKGGRCEQCQGEGFEKIEMQFLSDVYVSCSACQGKRYTPGVLEITYQDKNIHDVLQMTVAEARSFFAAETRLLPQLQILEMVGLGYLKLGQPLNTLSGGESQRLKVASIIKTGQQGHTLFLFDEPTTGLHFEDIKNLLDVFSLLLERGHSLIVVEHNLDFIKCADHILDLGPEGGDEGGYLVAQGPPEKIAAAPRSFTGAFLSRYLSGETSASLPAPGPDVPAYSDTNKHIVVSSAREHNLKNITVSIPREKVVVITGLSGSGKSTLAFDILFAEGQRRFLETLSPYARQYITQLDRPEVDSLRGIPPTVAIEQRLSRSGSASTVATLTEIYHYLRLLYAKAGEQHCPTCGELLAANHPEDIAEDILRLFSGKAITILAPLVKGRKGFHRGVIDKAKQQGFEKIRINGRIVKLQQIFAVQRYQLHQIELVTAELTPSRRSRGRLLAEVHRALAQGKGTLHILSARGELRTYSTRRFCSRCGIGIEEPDPRLFSFHGSQGTCSACAGTGKEASLAADLLAPDQTLSINEGAVIPLASEDIARHLRKKILQGIETGLKIDPGSPLQKLSAVRRKALFYGNSRFPGIISLLHDSAGEEDGDAWGQYLAQFCRETACSSCSGARLNQLALSVTIGGRSIADITHMTPPELLAFITSLSFPEKQQAIAAPVVQEIRARLEFLEQAGLSYLSLDRGGDTLSGGEAQRIRLAAQMGSNLCGVAYILDEPTIGLHPHDNKNLLRILRTLQKNGNSLIIVEHDEETIRSADFVIDLGPGGGIHGGAVVAAGTPAEIMACSDSLTGACLARTIDTRSSRQPRPLSNCSWIAVEGAREHNLKNISVQFPAGRLIVVTGVSGSGKSTLVKETLYWGVKKLLNSYNGSVGVHDRITGADQFTRVAEIDQSPIGKTPRSTPATYIGFYADIRNLFAQVPEALVRGFTASRFSFNVSGGRCEKCSGQGKIKMEMSFLPDVYVACDVCRGARFNEETQSVLLKGKTISQVLDMTVEEACDFFAAFPSTFRPLQLLQRMGLGYMTLGQQSPTLSGGEAQRIKIAYELSRTTQGRTLYILDEPTTGLHLADIDKLMDVLHDLVDLGNTMVIIEHNLEVIRQADYIIDMGPEGGDQGGFVTVSGSPQDVAKQAGISYTARYLNEYLKQKNILPV
jgi:excinuclease ABC subunit A